MTDGREPRDTTKEYYELNASACADRTIAVPLGALWDAFARRLQAGAYVLDLGCGAGRDLKELSQRGLRMLGLDYSAELAAIARDNSGQEVIVTDMRDAEFPPATFDGVWSVASLLHLSRDDVGEVLGRIYRWLRPGGALFTSMMRGTGHEEGRDGRRFELYEPAEWEFRLTEAGFIVRERHDTTAPNRSGGRDASEVVWFAMICEKASGP